MLKNEIISLFLKEWHGFCVYISVMEITRQQIEKMQRKASRDAEIARYGKQVSMRPSRAHKSLRDYNRKEGKKVVFD